MSADRGEESIKLSDALVLLMLGLLFVAPRRAKQTPTRFRAQEVDFYVDRERDRQEADRG